MKGSVCVYLTVDYNFIVYPEGYQKLCVDYNPMTPGAHNVGGGHSSHQAGIKVGALAQAAVGAGLGLQVLCHFDNLFHIFTILFPDL